MLQGLDAAQIRSIVALQVRLVIQMPSLHFLLDRCHAVRLQLPMTPCLRSRSAADFVDALRWHLLVK